MKDYTEFSLDDEAGPKATWARYIFGVCREMMALGVPVQGFNTAFAGDVPLGAGMSSSAALESTYAYALNDLWGDNKIEKMSIEDGNGSKAKFTRTKDGGIKVAYDARYSYY